MAKAQSIKHYVLPDGRKVHITASPSDAESLKRELSNVAGEPTDVYVRSSPEHLETIRTVVAHHRQKHEEIRRQHSHVFDVLDPVAAELETLGAELSTITDRHVALDANFDRYGYSAHIRLREATEDESGAGGSESSSKSVSQTSDGQSQALPKSIRFWRRPVIRQYFHRGLIWRASQREEVAAYELFIDLLYVGIIATTGDAAAEGADGEALLQFVVTFFLTWKIWTELVLMVQWFEKDDIVKRLAILLTAVLLVGIASNIADAFESTYIPMVSFYIAGRLLQALWIIMVAVLNPMFRVSLSGITIGIIMPVVLWIGSIHVEYPQRLALIWVAIFFEMFDKATQTLIVKYTSVVNDARCQKFVERASMTPAINIEHRSERQDAFVTLIFGYMAVNLLFQHSGESIGLNGSFAKAVLGLVTAFSFNTIYFEVDNSNISVHAIRRARLSYAFWQSLHLPFVMAFTLASGTLARLVVAHDSPNTDPSQLTEKYALISEGEVHQAQRWFYSAGLGIALACMAGIALTHEHKATSEQRIHKHYRLLFRLAVSVVMICLPVAESLNSLDFIGIDTSLVVLVLAVEYWGSTLKGEPFWWDTSACSYSADCKLKKGDMEALGADGEVNITHLAEKNIKQNEAAHGVI